MSWKRLGETERKLEVIHLGKNCSDTHCQNYCPPTASGVFLHNLGADSHGIILHCTFDHFECKGISVPYAVRYGSETGVITALTATVRNGAYLTRVRAGVEGKKEGFGLFSRGFNYSLQQTSMPGFPDFVFEDRKLVPSTVSGVINEEILGLIGDLSEVPGLKLGLDLEECLDFMRKNK